MIFFFSYTDHLCGRSHVYRTNRPCLWKTTGTDLSSQPKTLTINNTTIYDLTDLHFICNNDSSSNEKLSLVKTGSSVTISLDDSANLSVIANIAD